MKAFYKLAALALTALAPALAAAAPPPAADLTVLAGRGQRFLLSLDGRPLTGYATRQLHISWLAPGRHLADVRVYSPYGPPVAFRTTIWLQPGVDSRYALASGPYGVVLQPLGGAPSYGGGYAAPYDGSPYPAPSQPVPYDPYGGAGMYPGNGNAPYGGNPYPTPSQPAPYGNGTAPGSTYPGQPAPYGGTTPGTHLAPLGPDDLNRLTQELRHQPTDALRIDAIGQALAGSSLQAEELARLLDYLGSEPGRVQLARLAYEHLADPENMSLVYQRLQPASVAEVQRALGQTY